MAGAPSLASAVDELARAVRTTGAAVVATHDRQMLSDLSTRPKSVSKGETPAPNLPARSRHPCPPAHWSCPPRPKSCPRLPRGDAFTPPPLELIRQLAAQRRRAQLLTLLLTVELVALLLLT